MFETPEACTIGWLIFLLIPNFGMILSRASEASLLSNKVFMSMTGRKPLL